MIFRSVLRGMAIPVRTADIPKHNVRKFQSYPGASKEYPNDNVTPPRTTTADTTLCGQDPNKRLGQAAINIVIAIAVARTAALQFDNMVIMPKGMKKTAMSQCKLNGE